MLSHLNIILASKSPRRQELLKTMGLKFRVELHEVDESFPVSLTPEEAALFIAEKKAKAFDQIVQDEVVITADTIVAIDNEILGKPSDEQDGIRMLNLLSGKVHDVITGVAISYKDQFYSFTDITKVEFRVLKLEEMAFYIKHYKPFDKAGAYGIQEWIGVTAIKKIDGSYTNVVGLPTEKLYEYLLKIEI